MTSAPPRIGDILVRRDLVDPQTLRIALAEQTTKHQRLVSMLITQTLIELDDGALALSELTGYPAVLERHFEHRSQAVATAIPLELCQRWAVFPLVHANDGTLIVCARDPSPMLAHALREALEAPVALAIAPAIVVEKIVRAICKAPPDGAPAFLPGQVDRPPPGWARRTVSGLILTPPPAPEPELEPEPPPPPRKSAPKLMLELDPFDSDWDEPLPEPEPEPEPPPAGPRYARLQSEPAIVVSSLTEEERELPRPRQTIPPSMVAIEPPPPPLPLSSSGIDVPPSDPANIIPDAAPPPDPAAIPVSYAPEVTVSGRQRSIAIPRITHQALVETLPVDPSRPLPSLDPPTSPPALALPRTSTLSAAYADIPRITLGEPKSSSGTTAPPPVADTTLVTQPAVVAQPTISTASTIGIAPPPPNAVAREIERALSRATADRLVIKHGAAGWKSILLLALDGDLARGNRGEGARLAAAASLQIPIATSALLRNARDSRSLTMTTTTGNSGPLAELLGIPAAVVPVLVDEEPVAFLAGGEPLGELSPTMEDLQILATALGNAYRRFR